MLRFGKFASVCAIALMAGNAGLAYAEDTVKVGLIFSLSGPGAVLGTEMQKGADLALEQAGGKLGGLDTTFIYEDDQRKPDVGKVAAERLTRSEKVDFVIGPSYSNVMMAVHTPTVRAGAILISPNPAPAPLAGKECNANYFAVPFQNDQPSEALGIYLDKQNIKRVMVITANYQAGKDVAAGFKRTYKGELAGEIYPSLEQNDFSAELTDIKSKAPEAVFAFLPGAQGVQFVKQYEQAGLKNVAPLYTQWTLFNGPSLDAIGSAAEGVYSIEPWTYDMDNPANKAFVEAFKKKYGSLPSNFAAMAYDAVRLIDGSVKKAGGIADKDAVRAAMRAASFESVRGDFAFANNHHPIHSMYLAKVVAGPDKGFSVHNEGLIAEKMTDVYAAQCELN
ncbi:ABC transporter substrate-binding protein [Agrobacterium sp.]|uniref:ABC transporter substrate-binding protein n=1 Tax=Agrobacterium sp. TaxID=361 RepID=UPI0028AD8A23|nr:ABC transporter substrate-binding protein [Agrobacterium sp.]